MASTSKRRAHHATKACNSCRRRRCKCDGVHPICGTCTFYGHECTWSQEEDARRPATKQLVESLRVRIRELESELSQIRAASVNDETARTSMVPSSGSSDTPAETVTTRSQPEFSGQSHLTMQEGNITASGPTSMWSTFPSDDLSPQARPSLDYHYQFIFQRDPKIPDHLQPRATQLSDQCEWDRNLCLTQLDSAIGFDRMEHDILLDRCFNFHTVWLRVVEPQSLLPGIPNPSSGMSCRMVRALGLCIDSRPWVESGRITPEELVARDWQFWSTFCQDKTMSLDYGRDYDMPLPHLNVNLPEVVEHLDQQLWPGDRLQPLAETEKSQPNRATRVFFETCKLMIFGVRIMDAVYSQGRQNWRVTQKDSVSDIHLQLDIWYNNLPENFTISARSTTKPLPHIIVLNIAYWWLLLLLHRPFYARTVRSASNASTDIPSSFTDLSVKICDRATVKIVQYVMLFDKYYGMKYFPLGMLQVIFMAGATLLVQSATLSESAQEKSRRLRRDPQMYLRTTGCSPNLGLCTAIRKSSADSTTRADRGDECSAAGSTASTSSQCRIFPSGILTPAPSKYQRPGCLCSRSGFGTHTYSAIPRIRIAPELRTRLFGLNSVPSPASPTISCTSPTSPAAVDGHAIRGPFYAYPARPAAAAMTPILMKDTQCIMGAIVRIIQLGL
ncbi:hypothetical protein RSAG8_03250, partial [Rhizoctonia solani AG-8 WAC10335]